MKPFTHQALLELLDDLRARIAAHDSFEGFLHYLLPTDEDEQMMEVPEDTYAMVKACWRIGNRDGQGGMTVVGMPNSRSQAHQQRLISIANEIDRILEADGRRERLLDRAVALATNGYARHYLHAAGSWDPNQPPDSPPGTHTAAIRAAVDAAVPYLIAEGVRLAGHGAEVVDFPGKATPITRPPWAKVVMAALELTAHVNQSAAPRTPLFQRLINACDAYRDAYRNAEPVDESPSPMVADQSCVKCGSADTWLHYAHANSVSDCTPSPRCPWWGGAEHFHRGCRRCQYRWSTNEVPPTAGQPA